MIVDAKIRMDDASRYSLNDLHKAAGGARRHEPSEWLSNQQTKELVSLLETTGIPVVKKEGRNGGTYVAKELVYAYAMWLNPAFHLTVLRAFDALANGRVEDAMRMVSRQTARLEAPYLTEAIKHRREVQHKPVMHYHFSNEFDLINRVALGKSAKEFRIAHGIAVGQPIRDHLSPLEMKCVENLQRANASMIDLGFEYEERKTRLHQLYRTRHAAGLLSEVQRLEA